jgi:3-hexulose-6-phosphate synthase/6-phospho-3-hexuloisomerase
VSSAVNWLPNASFGAEGSAEKAIAGTIQPKTAHPILDTVWYIKRIISRQHANDILSLDREPMHLQPPIIQIALDFPSSDEALAMARIGVEAGVDWLEAGTPLIVSQGLAPIGELVRSFPDYPVLADFKTMDSGGKNVHRTKTQGGHLMTVCANAPDETILSAVAASKETGVRVVADTIGVKQQASRARQCAAWGVDMIYLHYGADQRAADPGRDSTQWLEEVLAAVAIPVGVGCFGVEDAVRAVKQGADLVAIGHPVISGSNPLAELRQFVQEVRANYRPRATV